MTFTNENAVMLKTFLPSPSGLIICFMFSTMLMRTITQTFQSKIPVNKACDLRAQTIFNSCKLFHRNHNRQLYSFGLRPILQRSIKTKMKKISAPEKTGQGLRCISAFNQKVGPGHQSMVMAVTFTQTTSLMLYTCINLHITYYTAFKYIQLEIRIITSHTTYNNAIDCDQQSQITLEQNITYHLV